MFGNSIGNGVGTVALLTFSIVVIDVIAGALPGEASAAIWQSFWFIGVVQLLYVIPLYIRWKESKPESAKGVIIGASIVALLNASCWGVARAIFGHF